MSSLNYTTYVSQTANLMAAVSSDPNFVTMLPGAIDYAEQRIYRELDLLRTLIVDASVQASSGVRNFSLPTSQGTFITVSQINAISPAGTASTATTAVRNQVIPASRDFIDATYPTAVSVQTGVPEYYAMLSDQTVSFGPTPDQAYFIEVVGTQRPVALSSANSSTILTQYVPDLFMAATMVFVSGFMRDFGQQSDNPQMGASWEQQYQALVKTAAVEQFRAKYRGDAWTAEAPSPVAQPPRR